MITKINIIITAHIDDLLIFAQNKEDIKLLKEQLEKQSRNIRLW